MQAILIPLFIGVALGSGLIYFLGRPRRQGPAAPEPARFLGREVEGMLKKAGFEILGKQPRKTVMTVVNGKDHFGYVEADYIVRKGKSKYVAVVKIGEGTSDPNEPVLRRRFIECQHVFSPDGLLLVDVERGEIHKISFRFPHERGIDIFFKFLIVLLVILMIIGIIWLLATLKLI